MSEAVLLDSLLIRRNLTVLIGAPFSGKTTLCMQLVAALQNECPDYFGLKGQPNLKVALLTCDQSSWSYVQAAEAAGADLTQVQWFSQQRDASLAQQKMFDSRDKEEGYQYFLETMDKLYLNHGIDLFIAEPLGTWLNCNILDYRQASQRMSNITTWLESRSCAILGTMHHGKAVSSKQFFRPVDRVYAGAPLLSHCASAIVLDLGAEISKRPTSPTIARLSILQRSAQGQNIWIDRDAITGRWVVTNPNATLAQGPSERQLSLLAFIERYGQCLRGDIKHHWLGKQGIGEKTLDRDLMALAKAGLIINDRPGKLPTSPYRVVQAGSQALNTGILTQRAQALDSLAMVEPPSTSASSASDPSGSDA